MNNLERRTTDRWNLAAYACILGSLLVVLLMGIWGLYRDLKLSQSTILEGAVSRLRAQATRRVSHLETVLEHGDSELRGVKDDEWFRQYWSDVTPLQERQLYAAIVDTDGTILFHTDPSLEGRKLSRRWYDRVIPMAGGDVVEIEKNLLAEGRHSIDMRIPLVVNKLEVGDYHEGLDKMWIDEQVAASRRQILARWSIVVGTILVVIVVSLISLYYLASRAAAWRQAVSLAHMQRITEVGQLAAGLAHEIRNPLYAIRLNLHTLRRALSGDADLDAGEVYRLTGESQQEIDRVDQLLRELLGFASPEQATNENLDVREEICTTLGFLSKELQRNGVKVDTTFPRQPATVYIDRNRFRQIMLNVLLNAKEVMSDGGTIHVSVRQRARQSEIVVTDEGPGIPQQEREKIFDPFYTTKEDGTGFGLAIVKKFVAEAGGSIRCSSNGDTGTSFRIKLPAGDPRAGKGTTS